MLTYSWCGATDTGKVRTENQDSLTPIGIGEGAHGVVAVADGLGGHPGGDIASASAIKALTDAGEDARGPDLVKAAHDGIKAKIVETMDERPELIAMATTLTLAILDHGGSVEIAHVGDSRAYVLTGSGLTQVTNDHTYGMDSVLRGETTMVDARRSADWHVLSNWLGFESHRVELVEVAMSEGDRLLLCTDGLSNMISDVEIAELMEHGSPGSAASGLIAAANAAGGVDNIAVVVVEAIA